MKPLFSAGSAVIYHRHVRSENLVQIDYNPTIRPKVAKEYVLPTHMETESIERIWDKLIIISLMRIQKQTRRVLIQVI